MPPTNGRSQAVRSSFAGTSTCGRIKTPQKLTQCSSNETGVCVIDPTKSQFEICVSGLYCWDAVWPSCGKTHSFQEWVNQGFYLTVEDYSSSWEVISSSCPPCRINRTPKLFQTSCPLHPTSLPAPHGCGTNLGSAQPKSKNINLTWDRNHRKSVSSPFRHPQSGGDEFENAGSGGDKQAPSLSSKSLSYYSYPGGYHFPHICSASSVGSLSKISGSLCPPPRRSNPPSSLSALWVYHLLTGLFASSSLAPATHSTHHSQVIFLTFSDTRLKTYLSRESNVISVCVECVQTSLRYHGTSPLNTYALCFSN